ncbi:MAG: phosphoribosylformylglycinamidine synthase subunit PurS [Candidatus Dormibacteria bacterium]
MAAYVAEVHVTLKPLVNDPAGLVIRDGLRTLGFHEVEGVRAGKYIVVEVQAPNHVDAEHRVREMCQKLLANPVIEEFRLQLKEAAAS